MNSPSKMFLFEYPDVKGKFLEMSNPTYTFQQNYTLHPINVKSQLYFTALNANIYTIPELNRKQAISIG